MPAAPTLTTEQMQLAKDHISLADQISRRLVRRYGWVGLEDLHSYAYLGIMLAARTFDAERGVPFDRFACTKAMFLAIDEMRKDGILRRADAVNKAPDAAGIDIEVPDPSVGRDEERLEAREFCSTLLGRLSKPERELLTMVYAEKLTYKEISAVFDISESAVCLRHKAVLHKLRRQASVRKLAA